ncbi:MAG TPA: hypothetical protein VJR50_01170 [Mycobacterium sp.]|nr:hypothetical protein [Mycobacterium sp.]
MAHSTVRIAAGAGLVAASLLIVGPTPAPALADKYGSSNDDYRNNGSAKRGGVSNVVKDVINGINSFTGAGADNKSDRNPTMDVGGGAEELYMVQSAAPEGQMAMRSAAVPEAPVGDNIAAAVPGGGGSDYSGQPVSAFRSPRVTIGNGRTPGTHVAQPPSAGEAVLTYDARVAPEGLPDAPAVPTGIDINIPPLPPPLPSLERIGPAELVVGQIGYGTTDTVTDPLAGVAGLFLIPAIGAVLGYRQARAAQSLRESLRTKSLT